MAYTRLRRRSRHGRIASPGRAPQFQQAGSSGSVATNVPPHPVGHRWSIMSCARTRFERCLGPILFVVVLGILHSETTRMLAQLQLPLRDNVR